ncbi:DUF58 domain-containing protein [Taibaiella lutea]|uniref:DUF58 domain-containing protein n=2 Tax=Taibaiella lutea TaxID=2608001 RepID=A0A5M6CPU6_9BACT|nr:DUF58 domain-containing protein [Taibaiella lutea]
MKFMLHGLIITRKFGLNMKWNSIKKRVSYYLQYFPFTLNAFILGVALWLCFQWLKPGSATAEDDATASFVPVILLIGKITLWFVTGLISFSVLSTFVCWIHFLFLSGKGYKLDIEFQPAKKGMGLWMQTLLQKARRPFLGFIKARLFYDDFKITDKFTLASNQRIKHRFWRQGVSGKSKMQLPDIKEYKLQGGFVFFEDMLQLFSLPVKQDLKSHFHNAPESITLKDNPAIPRKTEDTDTRIEQLRRVDGEYLNYKDFESGDDVRRVVWKVYAKNRELMVRVPEIFDPYASHIYCYASFHKTNDFAENDFTAEMLNYYKTRIWTVYETLSRKEFEVRFVPDQELHLPEQTNKDLFVQKLISNSHWQESRSLADYFELKYGSVLCISSMNSIEEIKEVLEQCNNEVVVYYVKLSNTFRTIAPLTWLKRVFILPPNDRLKRIRSRWILTPMRWKLVKKEKEIENILNKLDLTVVTL